MVSAIPQLTITIRDAKIPKEIKGIIGVKLVARKARAVVAEVRKIEPFALLKV